MAQDKEIKDLAEKLATALVQQKVDTIDFDKKATDLFNKKFEKVVEKLVPIKFVVNGKKVEGATHKDFPTLIKLIGTGEPVFIYGPAGSGKTHTAVQCAEALGLDHYSISVNEQTTKTDFLGYFDANSNLIKTNFRKAYEGGGMYIIDEIDAANPNVLTVLNSALSNGFMAFPDGNVTRHEKFVCVTTANTTGDENDVQYIGRNILDAATLDRFVRFYFDYDPFLEEKMLGKEVIEMRNRIREHIKNKKLNDFLSTRTLRQVQKLFDAGFTLTESLRLAMKPPQSILDLADASKVKKMAEMKKAKNSDEEDDDSDDEDYF